MAFVSAVLSAAVLASGATWFIMRTDSKPAAAKPAAAAQPFWQVFTGLSHALEANPPEDVDEATGLSDAIVVAHVTGVTEGRENRGWGPPDSIDYEKTVFVQLKVDRVVKGSVTRGQVLNLDMPPIPIDTVRGTVPDGQLLLFLSNRAEGGKRGGFGSEVTPADYNIWTNISNRGVVAEGPKGLYTPLDDDQPASWLASFDATTVQGAADRAARNAQATTGKPR